MDIEKFSECCLAKLCRDESGKLDLVVCCILRDPNTGRKVVKKKQIDLNPVVEYVQAAISRYHDGLHQKNPQVSGWDDTVDSALETAKRMGEARMVKALYHEVSPFLAHMEGGEESEMHQKAHEVLVKAREGDRNALDTMSALMNSAYRGSARALEIMTLMRDMNLALDGKEAAEISGVGCAGMTTPELIEIGSFWSKFKKVAKVATAPIWAPTYLATKAISKVPGLRHINKINPAAWAINRMQAKPQPAPPRVMSRPMRPLPPPAAPPSDQGYGMPPPAAPPSDQGYAADPGYADPGYAGYEDAGYGGEDYGYQEDQEFAGPQEEVAGWMYNKGYRTVPEAITSKFPGLGLSVREMYHRGLDSGGALAIAPIPDSQATVSGTYVVGLSWGSLMKKAKKMVKVIKDTDILQKAMPMIASAIPGGGMALEAAKHAAHIVALAKEGKHEAVKVVAAVRAMAADGNQQALETAKVMQQMSNKLDDKAAQVVATQPEPAPVPAPAPTAATPVYAPIAPQVVYRTYTPRAFYARPARGGFYHRGLGHDWMNKHLRHMGQPQVAGWLYNKPYRGVLEAPGTGVVLREMYNRGEGRQPTELLDVLRQIFPTRSA